MGWGEGCRTLNSAVYQFLWPFQLPAMNCCHFPSATVRSALSCHRRRATFHGSVPPGGRGPVSPQPVLFLLPQLHVPLHHLQDVLRLVVRQGRQVQPPAHCSWLGHAGLLVWGGVWAGGDRGAGSRRGTATADLGAGAGTTLKEGQKDGKRGFGSGSVEEFRGLTKTYLINHSIVCVPQTSAWVKYRKPLI